jgi:predicted anti-sigma-YlaC factor YlaD
MFCDEALDAIEAIAAGELTPEGRVAAHLTSCPNCAAALASARRLEQMLQARPVQKAPPQFTSRTMAVLRRQRWRSEQFLDVGFNVALGTVALVIIGIVWMVLHRTGIVSVNNPAVNLIGSSFVRLAHRVAPSVPLYVGATALLVTALGLWWWAEKDATL